MLLTERQIKRWNERGWLKCDYLLTDLTIARLPLWVDELSTRTQSVKEKRLHYYEQTDTGPVLCRTERFLEDITSVQRLICCAEIIGAADELLGEPATLLKEKINYKQPGGAGFSAHQDAVAYSFAKRHLTCVIAIDDMTVENGCLEFARDHANDILPINNDGCIDQEVAQTLSWEPVEMPRGAVTIFGSLMPHRSSSNQSDKPRRAMFLTYNPLSEGIFREQYYASREASLESQQSQGHSAISTIRHFQGQSAGGAR
ncbi:MAG: phytanoyl-CoA dioxygenase family protein [Pseudomonadota bacterium]